MPNLNHNVSRVIENIRIDFDAKLRGYYLDITEILSQKIFSEFSEDEFLYISEVFHKISGIAPMFGYFELGTVAARFDLLSQQYFVGDVFLLDMLDLVKPDFESIYDEIKILMRSNNIS